MKRQVKLNEQALKQIESAVAEAEKKTSGEIVPMIVSASHDYWWIHWLGACIGGLMATSVAVVWSYQMHSDLGSFEILLHQIASMIIGFSLPFLEPIKRLFIPKKWAAEKVHRQCLANFMAAGLQETRDRTGVLIYLSLLEHRVEILADKGISDKTPKDYWKNQVTIIVKGVHAGKTSEAIVEVVEHIGQKLAENFPPRQDDSNELSNQVRLGHHSISNEKKDD